MAFTEQTRPYETLIRHNEGGGIGAHHVTINEVLKDGVVISASPNPPVPIYGAELEQVIGAAVMEAVSHCDQLAVQLSQCQNLIESLEQQLVTLTAEKNDAVTGREAAIAELTTAGETIAALRKRVETFESLQSTATSSAGA